MPRLSAFTVACAAPMLATGLEPWSFALGMTACGLVLARGVAHPRSSLLVPTTWHRDRGRSSVALTFDDGPDPTSTPAILDALERFEARATFFMIGRHAQRHPQVARAVREAGHAIGNHTQTHPRTLNLRGAQAIRREIDEGERSLRDVLGIDAALPFRPPMGLRSPSLANALREAPREVITWSVHSRDRRAPSPQAIATRVLRRVREGDIVVLHDGNDRDAAPPAHTAGAVTLILEGLRERGLRVEA